MLTYTDQFCETIHVGELLIYSYQEIIALLGKSYIALDSACYYKVKSSKLNFSIDLFLGLKWNNVIDNVKSHGGRGFSHYVSKSSCLN